MALRLKGELQVDAKKGTAEIRKFGRAGGTEAKRTAREFGRVDRQLERVGKTAAGARRLITGLVGGITAAVVVRDLTRTIAGYEQTMATVRGVTQATDDEFAALSERARVLGATTRFSAQEAAEGMLFLARAGFSTEQSLSAVGATLNLAAAGAIGLGEAADYASNIVSQFGLAAYETERVVDTLLNTSNSANTNVQQLAQALKFAGPVAGALGRSVEETAAALGVLGDSGIQASLAGTNLRGSLAALLQPTAEGTKAIERMGYSLDQLSPASNDLVTVWQRFSDAGLTAAEAVAIFGRRNAAAALVLSRSVDKIRDLTKANEEARGEAERMAKLMQDTLAGAFKTLRSTVEEAFLVIGDEGFTGGLRGMVETTTQALRILLNMPGAYGAASEGAKDLAVAFVAVKDAATAFIALRMGASLLATASAVRMLALGTGTLAATFSAFSPILVGAIGLISYFASETNTASAAQERFESINKSVGRTVKSLTRLQRDYNLALSEGDTQKQIRNLRQRASMLETEIKRWKELRGEFIKQDQVIELGIVIDPLRERAIDILAEQAVKQFKDAVGKTLPETQTFTAAKLVKMFEDLGVDPGLQNAAQKAFEKIVKPAVDTSIGALEGRVDPKKLFRVDTKDAKTGIAFIYDFAAALKGLIPIDEVLIAAAKQRRDGLNKEADALKKGTKGQDEYGKAAREVNEVLDAQNDALRKSGLALDRRISDFEKYTANIGKSSEELELSGLREEAYFQYLKEGTDAAYERYLVDLMRIDIAEAQRKWTLEDIELEKKRTEELERQKQAQEQLIERMKADHRLRAETLGPTFGGGFGFETARYVAAVRDAFATGERLAGDTAQAMAGAFDRFLFDALTGKFETVGDAVRGLLAGLGTDLLRVATREAALQLTALALQPLGLALTSSAVSAAGALASGGAAAGFEMVAAAKIAAGILATGGVTSGATAGTTGALAGALAGALGGIGHAKGSVFADRTVAAYAAGGIPETTASAVAKARRTGIVDEATLFRTASDELGVMGEDGLEAILPAMKAGGRYAVHAEIAGKRTLLELARLQDGVLGVKAYQQGGVIGGGRVEPAGLGGRMGESTVITIAPVIHINNPRNAAEAEEGVRRASKDLEKTIRAIAKKVFKTQYVNTGSRSQVAMMARSRI